MSKRTVQGVVTSDARDKTITVTVTSRETHPIYRKQYSVNRKYAAHDEKNEAKVGDTVTITETRPISRSKHFELTNIVVRSKGSVKVRDDVEEVA
jgi:small subunit ribosomal protein S17